MRCLPIAFLRTTCALTNPEQPMKWILSSKPLSIRNSASPGIRRFAVTALSSSPAVVESLPRIPPNAHRIVLMRHGESEFNNANIFTGWCDVALTQRGVVEAVEAGQVFRSHELHFRKCYTSMLTRSIVTAHRTLEAAGVAYTPMVYDWRNNERHYGALQGLSKERTADRLGRKLVMKWRRSFDARPPLMTEEHPHYEIIQRDRRYQHLQEIIPLGESLQDCQKRVIDSWNDVVKDIGEAQDQEYSLMVTHANSLRALVMHLDQIPSQEIEGLNIPTAIPFYYDIDLTTGQVVSNDTTNSNTNNTNSNNMNGATANKIGLGRFRGIYISDERKKRSFLERRRAANDPWLWALHDHQVARSMLVQDSIEDDEEGTLEGLKGVEDEAKRNTQVFSSALNLEHEMPKK